MKNSFKILYAFAVGLVFFVRYPWAMMRLVVMFWRLVRNGAFGVIDHLPSARMFKLFWALRRDKERHREENLAAGLSEMGPGYVKLGQALSVRADIIGTQLALALSRLQDRLPSFDAKTARAIIESEIGPIDENFKQFNEQAVAAASIAQVHQAVTLEGQKVAVKVLRPNIDKIMKRDLVSLRIFAEYIAWVTPHAERLNIPQLLDTIEDWCLVELDMTMEAAANSRLAHNFSERDEAFKVPTIDWQRTSTRVLVMEWIDGCRIDNDVQLEKWGLDKHLLLEKCARIFFLQIFTDGYFHADIHPGNLFVTKQGDIVPVDFGIMGQIDIDARLFIIETMWGFLDRDYHRVSEAHFRYGLVPYNHSRQRFEQTLASIGEPLLSSSMQQVSLGRLLSRLLRIAGEFEMQVQPGLILLQKTLLMAEGLGQSLAPNENIWILSKPLIEQWVAHNFSPQARLKRGLQKIDLEVVFDQLSIILQKLADDDDARDNISRNIKSVNKHSRKPSK